MLERDPELEAMLAPERQALPPPPAALTKRLWQRISASVRTAPSGARGPIGPALLIITGVLGAAVGAWAVSSFRSQAPTPAPASVRLVESPKVDARVDAGETTAAPTATTDEAARPTREPDSRRPPSAEERAGKRDCRA